MTTRKSHEVIDAEDLDVAEPAPTPSRKSPTKRAQPHKPAGVKQPTDRPKSAAQREAEAEDTVTVEWEGMTFSVPSDPDEWDFWTVTQPLAAQNIPMALTGLLGPQQMMQLRIARPDIRNPEIRDLFNIINKAIADINTGN